MLGKKIKLPDSLKRYSEKIGKDSLQIQGPGGNTSYKLKNQMWVKASGTKLADASEKNIFVLVDRNKVLDQIDNFNHKDQPSPTIYNPNNLKPSIETSFHALIPHKFVIHTHSINTIIHSISPEGRSTLKHKLENINWFGVNYKKPGLPLTIEIKKKLHSNISNLNEGLVIILYNHGLIVAGETIEKVKNLISKVEKSLKLKKLYKNFPIPSELIIPKNWEWLPEFSALCKVKKISKIIHKVTLYPDHVVFLGKNIPKCNINKIDRLIKTSKKHKMILIENYGVIINSEVSLTDRAMAACLYEVLSRLPKNWNIRGLTNKEINELINWDAEKYRKKLSSD